MDVGNDAVLKVHYWVLADTTPTFFERTFEGDYVTGFVRTLPRDGHADIPIRVGKINERARGILHAIYFFIHLAVKKFHSLSWIALGKMRAFAPAIHYI